MNAGGPQQQSAPDNNYQLPPDNKLPAIYQPDSSDFAASAGRTIAQPEPAPRKMEPSANKIFIAVGIGEFIGIGLIVFAFGVMPEALHPMPLVVGVIGILIAVVANAALLSELPRLGKYARTSFTPGVLVYGPAERFKEVLGAGGIVGMQSRPVMPIGEGGVSKLLKRENPMPCPHEMVGLHVNRGKGPEIIPVDWSAVREFVRGDIVWFNTTAPQKYIFFHKLYPYCPNVRADRGTRDSIYTSLMIGGIQQVALPKSNAMGKTKAFDVNASGQIVSSTPGSQSPVQGASTGGNTGTVGLGEHLGGGITEESFQVPDVGQGDPNAGQGLSDPNQGFGQYDQDFGNDDRQA
ncbi:MAG: hypothetical protein ACYTDT_11695 [Planctomycetota bacterium]|jgi:hypothetical protein